MQDGFEVCRLQVVELLRGREGCQFLAQSAGRPLSGPAELTRSAEKYLDFWIRSWTFVATSSTRRHACSVSIVSSIFCPTLRASSRAFFCRPHVHKQMK